MNLQIAQGYPSLSSNVLQNWPRLSSCPSFLTCVERGEKGLGFDSIVKVSCALETSTDYLLTGVIRQNESDYVHRLLELLDETQRDHTVEVLKHLLIIGGHTPPES